MKAPAYNFAENEERAMRRIGIILLFLLTAIVIKAQSVSDIDRIMRFEGVSDPEELDPYDVERLEDLLQRPLRINQASLSRLKESGLFTHYQAVSLIDYRSRHGDVLSYSELVSVDGFGVEFVERTAPFISMESASLPGKTLSGSSPEHEVAMKMSMKAPIGSAVRAAPSYALKYALTDAGQLSAGIAFARTYDADGVMPETMSGYIRYDFQRGHGKLIAGDFNARFGQGLALWNGMSIGSQTSPSAYMKRSSGLSPSSSYTGVYALHGLAADFAFNRFRLSALIAVENTQDGSGILPAANMAYFGRYAQISVTHYATFMSASEGMKIPDMKTSADLALCIKGIDFFTECAFDWSSESYATLAGAVFPAGEDVRMAGMIRFYPTGYSPLRSAAARSTSKCTNEHAVSFSGEASLGRWISLKGKEGFGSSVRKTTCSFSIDVACFPDAKEGDDPHDIQIKANTEWTVMLAEAIRLKLKVSERIRSWGRLFRTEVRTDIAYMTDPWNVTLRLNAVRSDGTGVLAYLEGGYKTEKTAFYLRQGAFLVDSWDDRIYSYERDAPGSFNVPAYYGRGMWGAAYLKWNFMKKGRLYLRCAIKKLSNAELKLLMSLLF